MLEEKSIDLMEDGFIQAARALSEERIEYIASLLKNSLTDEDLEHIAHKRLLFLLDELNDFELLLLKAYSMPGAKHGEFWIKHNLNKPSVHLGSSQEEVDKNAIHGTYFTNLTRLGLLTIRFQKPKRGELPEFDEKTGMVKSQGYNITSLGRLLLRTCFKKQEIVPKCSGFGNPLRAALGVAVDSPKPSGLQTNPLSLNIVIICR